MAIGICGVNVTPACTEMALGDKSEAIINRKRKHIKSLSKSKCCGICETKAAAVKQPCLLSRLVDSSALQPCP